jgi:hypothetical protein
VVSVNVPAADRSSCSAASFRVTADASARALAATDGNANMSSPNFLALLR